MRRRRRTTTAWCSPEEAFNGETDEFEDTKTCSGKENAVRNLVPPWLCVTGCHLWGQTEALSPSRGHQRCLLIHILAFRATGCQFYFYLFFSLSVRALHDGAQLQIPSSAEKTDNFVCQPRLNKVKWHDIDRPWGDWLPAFTGWRGEFRIWS